MNIHLEKDEFWGKYDEESLYKIHKIIKFDYINDNVSKKVFVAIEK